MSLNEVPGESVDIDAPTMARLYKQDEISSAIERDRSIIFVMSEVDAHVVETWGYPSTCLVGPPYTEWEDSHVGVLQNGLSGARVIFIPKGKAGVAYMSSVSDALRGSVASFWFGVVPIKFGADASLADMSSKGGTKDDFNGIVEGAKLLYGVDEHEGNAQFADAASENGDGAVGKWQNPEPLPDPLQPVRPFDFELLPGVLHGRVHDIAERMQCPPDFVAIGVMTGSSSIIGRQLGVRPKRQDDWTVVCNLYGLGVGPPSVLKSPALEEAIKEVRRLELAAKDVYEEALKGYEADLLVVKVNSKNVEKAIALALKGGDSEEAKRIALESQEALDRVTRERFMTNDTTVEKLGELLAESDRCILVFRDELSGFLRTMDREDRSSERGFYLEAWGGTSLFYTYDRISRGTIDIPRPCVSILGGIQPGPLQEYIAGAVNGSKGADGLLQRFQLAVWPDISPTWKNVDRWPDKDAKDAVSLLFDRLAKIDTSALKAQQGEYDNIPFLRFTPEAQALFDEWRAVLEGRIRGGDLPPAFEAHLAKYRSLVPSIALICHLIEGDDSGAVGEESLLRALAWSEYLESHAKRIYAYATHADLAAARELFKHIKRGDLSFPFSARDVYRRHWTMLDKEGTEAAVSYLEDFGWIREVQPEQRAGRPSAKWEVHPSLLRKI